MTETSVPPTPAQPEEYVELALVRHGKSMLNHGETVQGQGADPANVLHPIGVGQAHQAAAALRAANIHPVSAHTSPLPRARQTGETVLEDLGYKDTVELQEHKGLLELSKGTPGHPGALEGLIKASVETDAYNAQRTAEGWDFRYGSAESGGQTMREVGIRTLAALTEIAMAVPASDVEIPEGARPARLVFGHGMAIRAALGMAGGLDMETTDGLKLGNGDTQMMRYYPDRPEGQRWELGERITAAGADTPTPQN